jgi:serine/threonine-protein kinase
MADSDQTVPTPRPDGTAPPEDLLARTRRLENTFTRYLRFEELGAGGIGAVRSCVDPYLGRTVALKSLHGHLQDQEEQRTRFIREARVMARIEHPNIVPVHELGTREDGSVYFTMKRVVGVEMQQVLAGLRDGEPEVVESYPRPRLLDVFTHVCQAVAFAHTQRVIHRDLKPANILIGAFGEVLVLDWGLAKFLDDPIPEEEGDGADPRLESTLARVAQSDVTVQGAVSGTPLYMSPEQAAGRVDLQDERSDLYTLGAILYELLTLERTVSGNDLQDVLDQVAEGEIIPPRRRCPDRKIPRELDAICMKALEKKRDARYPSVVDLIRDLDRYGSGRSVSVYRDPLLVKAWKATKRHPVVSAAGAAVLAVIVIGLVSITLAERIRYERLMAEADGHREAGDRLFADKVEAFRELEAIRTTRILKKKDPRETALDAKIAGLHARAENEYEGAVMLYLLAAGETEDDRRFAALQEIYSNRLDWAFMTGGYAKAGQILDWLRGWLGPNFEKARDSRPKLLAYAENLKGEGSLRLATRPPRAAATLYLLEEDEQGVRRPGPARTLGLTPLRTALAKGSYLVTLKLPDRPEVRYPVRIDHGENERADVVLPLTVPEGTVYVPGGKYYAGGATARYYRLHEREVKGFFIARHEVTYGEYLAYWLDTRSSPTGEEDRSLVRLDRAQRCYTPAWGQDGKLIPALDSSRPVVGITQAAAARYCAWLGRKRSLPCRLPTADEWTKAARGVDARNFVWGDTYNPSLAFINENVEALKRFGPWAPPGSFPDDVSIYGAFDLGGNVREWTGSRFRGESPFYQIKGASAQTTRRFLRCEYASDTPVVPSDVGFRYVIEMTP